MDEIGIGNKVTLVIKSGVYFFPCVDNCIIDLFVWTAFRINLVVTKSKLVHLFWPHSFLFFPLQECQEFFRLLAVCHTVMVESNNGKNYWFFWSRESYTLSCRHISQGGFFHSDAFFFQRGGEGEEGGRLSFVRRFSFCVLLSTWAELLEGWLA